MADWLLIVMLVVEVVLVGLVVYLLIAVRALRRYAAKLSPWTLKVAELFWMVNWNAVAAQYPGTGGQVPPKPPDYP